VSAEFEVREYRRDDLASVVELCRAEGWPSFQDSAVASQALGAPGVIAASAESAGVVIGFGYGQTDGVVQAHLSLIVVERDKRRQGVATAIVQALLERSGAKRLDLITDEAGSFYESLPHRRTTGYRIYASTDG
jgi:ribosomal protein S18 acetylase RimI-like enzyme